MSLDLRYSDATAIAELIRTGKVSAVEVMQTHLDRIASLNPQLNAIVTVDKSALENAKAADAAVQSGKKDLGPRTASPSP